MWLRNRNPAAPVLRRYDGSGGNSWGRTHPFVQRLDNEPGRFFDPTDGRLFGAYRQVTPPGSDGNDRSDRTTAPTV